MHTPGHAVFNVAVLGTWLSPELAAPIVAGAVIPDLPIFVLYGYGRLLRKLPEARIWEELYPQKTWLAVIHGLHSLPMALLGALVAWRLGALSLAAFFASMTLHSLADFPIHGKDAHRHFLPFSSYRFISPISYWDIGHHAKIVAGVEALVVTLSAIWVGHWSHSLALRLTLACVVAGYAVGYRKLLLSSVSPRRTTA